MGRERRGGGRSALRLAVRAGLSCDTAAHDDDGSDDADDDEEEEEEDKSADVNMAELVAEAVTRRSSSSIGGRCLGDGDAVLPPRIRDCQAQRVTSLQRHLRAAAPLGRHVAALAMEVPVWRQWRRGLKWDPGAGAGCEWR